MDNLAVNNMELQAALPQIKKLVKDGHFDSNKFNIIKREVYGLEIVPTAEERGNGVTAKYLSSNTIETHPVQSSIILPTQNETHITTYWLYPDGEVVLQTKTTAMGPDLSYDTVKVIESPRCQPYIPRISHRKYDPNQAYAFFYTEEKTLRANARIESRHDKKVLTFMEISPKPQPKK